MVKAEFIQISSLEKPERLPITKPSNGVNPIVVSTHLPFLIAAKLAPFPKWQEIIFISSGFFPNVFAAAFEIN